MYYYLLHGQLLVAKTQYEHLSSISEAEALGYDGIVNILNHGDPATFRRSFCVSDPSLAFLETEGIHLLQEDNSADRSIPSWLLPKIEKREVRFINTAYPRWQEVITNKLPGKWRIHIFGMGDVGGMLAIGLRLLGGDCIAKIGIYARKPNVLRRWDYELNQVLSAFAEREYPEVVALEKGELFDCDMFVFCASTGVPALGERVQDVRMVQFEGNARLIGECARLARDAGFKGIFAVMSDPVDLLCKAAFLASNEDPATGEIDYLGLAPEQIRGYGLGVMHARACYYAHRDERYRHYLTEGRAFGPHGQGLVIADSIERYNDELSRHLTKKAVEANVRVRETGFKPYIAPALSSGALSILATIRGEWHYSASFMGGVYMGAKNRLLPTGVEIERLALPQPLFHRLSETYERLKVLL